MSDRTWQVEIHPSFRFVVEVEGEKQGAFTECTLPSIEWEMEEVKEGGLNTYTHQLPGRRKAATISLKNGVCKGKLFQWYMEAISKTVSRRPFTIILMDSHKQPAITWHIKDAYPSKWTGPQLKSDDNVIAIHTLELVCGDITVSLG